jgi:hypothetical protein
VPPSSSRTCPATLRVLLSLVAHACVVVEPHGVQVVPPSQVKLYWCASVLPGSTTLESERLIAEPSFTEAGAVKVADGATLFTVTVAEYSALSPLSSSRSWPLTLLVPLSVVPHA